jgi:DNA (cytosine-5)-methyltransferase 1
MREALFLWCFAMKKWAYYNDSDTYVCKWVENLIAAGHVTPGIVDCRPIQEVMADDIREFIQVHMFCGIAGWSLALRLAEWPDDRPVWTGSCPCQPFSAAGAGQAADDERHLWPAWFSLIRECRPGTIFGEQVEAAIGWGWLDAVFADLEQEGYACGAAVLPACGVGAPHIRQRLWFVADRDIAGLEIGRVEQARDQCTAVERGGATDFWSECDWLPCADGKARAVEPGIKPLVDGAAFRLGSGGAFEGKSRVGMLKAYGNAIVPQAAAAFIAAAMR